jgi:hypothetical protein
VTDPTTPPPATTDPAVPAGAITPPVVVRKLNIIGLVALILAVIGFVLAVIPPTAVVAWILLVPALVLAIIGLTRKGRGKATSLTALILSVVGWLIAIIVTVVVAASTVVSADNSTTITSGSGSSSHTKAPAKTAGIGDTVTNHDGVAFTVHSAACGLASAPDQFYGTDKPTGQFCQVKLTVKNGSKSSVTLSDDSLSGYIGNASYDSDADADNYGSLTTVLSPLNPGLSTDCTFYVDVPKGQKLTSVKLGTSLSFGVGDVTVDIG